MAIKTDVAREFRKSYGPDMPTLKLARIMYNKNKKLFNNIEDARGRLRYIEGKKGKAALKKTVTESEFLREDARPKNPYKLPESDETAYEPYILKGFQRPAIFCDIHAPYHNIEAISVALEYCKKDKVDALIIDGDMFDFHGASRFMKDPRKRKTGAELKIGCEIITIMHKTLRCPIIFKLGNHDERWMHYLWQKLGELDQLEDLEELESLNFHSVVTKRLPDIPITIVDDKRIIKAGDLNIVHGHEFGGSVFSPVNIARGFYLRAKANTIGGHHHRTSQHTEKNINEIITTTWSIGCLSELHPQYLPINSWNHGFAIVDIDARGKEFHVRNKSIYKGRVL